MQAPSVGKIVFMHAERCLARAIITYADKDIVALRFDDGCYNVMPSNANVPPENRSRVISRSAFVSAFSHFENRRKPRG